MNPSSYNNNILLLDGLQKAIHADQNSASASASTSTTATAVKEDGKKECLVMITDQESGQRKGEDHHHEEEEEEEEEGGRERLKRHRVDMAGRVWIPEIWGQESFLKDWIDCAAFDTCLVPKGLVLAREALVQECQPANSGALQIENRC